MQHYVSGMTKRMQYPLEVLPVVLKDARNHCLPGRESAVTNGVMWELLSLVLPDHDQMILPPCRVLPFPHRG